MVPGRSNSPKIKDRPALTWPALVGRREKTPTPKTRFSIWTLLRTPGRFTTRPLPVYFTTKMSVVRPFSVLSKDEISGPEKGVITKGVFSLEESLESLKSLNSLESLKNGRSLLCVHSVGVLQNL